MRLRCGRLGARLRCRRVVRASFSKIIPFRDVFRNMEFDGCGGGDPLRGGVGTHTFSTLRRL